MDLIVVVPSTPSALDGEVICICPKRKDASLKNEDGVCKNRGGRDFSVDGDRLSKDSVVDGCSWAVGKLDDRGDGFVGEGTGLV